MRWLFFLLAFASTAQAEGERAGDFDYYVMALSWSPTWCALTGDDRNSPQCEDDAGHGWILHGLWPQYERGWPSYCRTDARNPSRRQTADQADLFGTGGNAWHQWNKHGRCTGLTAEGYYALARDAYAQITRPQVFRKIDTAIRLPAEVVEDAFLEANPNLNGNQITITCRDNRIQEARICLTRDLTPRACGAGVRYDCNLDDALMSPIR